MNQCKGKSLFMIRIKIIVTMYILESISNNPHSPEGMPAACPSI